MTQRTDRIRIDGHKRDAAGFLIVNALPTRAGVFVYANPDGTTRRELRHPDEVFKADSMNSLRGKPLTDLHPNAGKVTSKNSRHLMVGFSSSDVSRTDDDFIKTSITVTDEDTIKKIESGQQLELSCGYSTDVIDGDGEYNGEKYDCIQTNINYNHIATVPAGRAGGKARIYCDSADDAATTDFDIEIKLDKHEDEPMTQKTVIALSVAAACIGAGSASFKADAISFEVDKELQPTIQPLLDRIDSTTAHAESLQTKIDSMQGTIDELQTKADSKMSPEDLNKIASERADILGVAGHVGLKDFNGKSNDEIKKSVVVAKNDGLNLDEKSEAYIDARYDHITEQIKTDAKGFKSLALLQAASKSEDPKHNGNEHNDNEDELSPRDQYLKDTSNMHKDTVAES